MARVRTLALVGGLALLAFLAALDGLSSGHEGGARIAGAERGDGPKPTGEAQVAVGRDGVRTLRRLGVSGLLFLVDGDCRFRALALPELGLLAGDSSLVAGCRLGVAPDGRRLVAGGVWAAGGDRVARAERGFVEVRGSGLRERLRGHAPAWRPDGALTLVQGGELRACDVREATCGEVVVPRAALGPLARLAGLDPVFWGRRFRVTEAQWLSRDRVAVVVRAEGDLGVRELLAVLDGGRPVGVPTVTARLDDLRVSPGRRYLAARAWRFRGLWFFDRDGRLLARNPIASGHHVAWSPDDRWTAVASGGSIYLFRSRDTARFETRRPPVVRVPLYAADLAWR